MTNEIVFLCMCLMGCIGFVVMSGTRFMEKLAKALSLFLALEGIALFILENVMAIK